MVIWLSWLAFLTFVLGCVASEALPFAWFTPSALPTVLVEAELAFLLVAWPLLLPRALSEAARAGGVVADLRAAATQAAALTVFATPLAALCAAAAEAGLADTLAGQAFPAGVAAGVALLAVAARRSGRDPWRVYYLVLAAASAGLPIAGFVLRDVGGRKVPPLAPWSPFCAAIGRGLPAWGLVGLLIASSALCAFWPRRSSSPA